MKPNYSKMDNRLEKIKKFWVIRTASYKKIEEAYLMRDSKYLKKAYKYGRNYLKGRIIEYLGALQTQENFEFLLAEMKIMSDINLRESIHTSILEYILNEYFIISEKDLLSIENELDLMEELQDNNHQNKVVNDQKANSHSAPVTLYHLKKNHLQNLEDLKKRIESLFSW